MRAVDILMQEESLLEDNMAYVDDLTTYGDTWFSYLAA